MGILTMHTQETDEQRAARRLQEKKHGRALAKLMLIKDNYKDRPEYILQRLADYGIPLDQVERDAPELFAMAKAGLEKQDSAKKAEKAPESPEAPKAKAKKAAAAKEEPKQETPSQEE